MGPVRNRRLLGILAVVLLLSLAAFIFRTAIFWRMGAMLDGSEPPQKADLILVLSGDRTGSRILKAAELVRQGIAPKAFISGAALYFGRRESEISIEYAVSHGYPREWFIPFEAPNLSTADEARSEAAFFRTMGVKRLLVVTHSWHTGRALRTFRRRLPDLDVRAAGVWDEYWNAGYWWTSREGRKLWFFEASKTVADFVERGRP